MALIWTPGLCPGRFPCRLAVEQDCSAVKQFLHMCPHHASLGLTDQQVFRALFQSMILRERARWEAKLALALDKEHPGVPHRVNADGSLDIFTDRASLAWKNNDGSTGALPAISTADRDRARVAALAAIAAIERPSGTSTLTVL